MKTSNRKKSLSILGAVMAGDIQKASSIGAGGENGGCMTLFYGMGEDKLKLMNDRPGYIKGEFYTKAEAKKIAGEPGMIIINWKSPKNK
jgi:hypothetical protein